MLIGKLLNLKDSATLSVASRDERERLVATIARKLHKKRRHANQERKRTRGAEIANAPEIHEVMIAG